MKPANEEKLFEYGCYSMLTLICGCVCLAFTLSWIYALWAACLLGAWFMLCRFRLRRDRRRHTKALAEAFSVPGITVPRLSEQSGYGFPSFKLTFPTEEALKQAEAAGCIAAFKQSLQLLYAHLGGCDNPFDAHRAVWSTYDGWQPQFTTLFQQQPSPLDKRR
jgi:hypothetical protein